MLPIVPPIYDSREFIENEFPFHFLLHKEVNPECKKGTIECQRFSIKLNKNDPLFEFHLLIGYSLFLQETELKKLCERIKLSKEQILYSLDILLSFSGPYKYYANAEKYLKITKILLDQLKSLEFESFQNDVEKLGNLVVKKQSIALYGVTYNKYNFEGFPFLYTIDPLVELISSYDSIGMDEDVDPSKTQCCRYCLVAVPTQDLILPCKCVDPVHIKCVFKEGKKICGVCKMRWETNEVRFKFNFDEGEEEKLVFFPCNDFYPVPLMSTSELRKVISDDRFIYALCYLQCKRMKHLISEIKKEEGQSEIILKKKLGSMLNYFTLGSMPSNYLKKNNQNAYNEMKKILFQAGVIF